MKHKETHSCSYDFLYFSLAAVKKTERCMSQDYSLQMSHPRCRVISRLWCRNESMTQIPHPDPASSHFLVPGYKRLSSSGAERDAEAVFWESSAISQRGKASDQLGFPLFHAQQKESKQWYLSLILHRVDSVSSGELWLSVAQIWASGDWVKWKCWLYTL